MSPDDLLARVLYRDGQMLVIDKPAGLPVHAGPGGGETLDALFDHLRFGLPRAPALAHRLDRDTSGCLVLGRHRRALAELGALFAGRSVEKTYLAVVLGRVDADEGVVDAPLAKVSHERRSWWMKVDPAGQPSVSRFRVVARGDTLSVVDLMPETGRTHQLRVHMAHLGHPIVGDGVYGGDPARKADRALHLHARRLVIPFYRKKPPVDVVAPLPAHMMRLLTRLGAVDEDGALRPAAAPAASPAPETAPADVPALAGADGAP